MWAVIQIDLEETDDRRAKKKGIYRCRWYGPHPDDRKHKSPRESRLWPVVHRIDGQGFFREQHVVSPDKVHGLLDRRFDLGWYQLDIDVGSQRLTMPFDFTSITTGNRTEKWRIADLWWNLMIEQADKVDVPTGDVDRAPRPRPTRPGRGEGRVRGRGRGRGRR